MKSLLIILLNINLEFIIENWFKLFKIIKFYILSPSKSEECMLQGPGAFPVVLHSLHCNEPNESSNTSDDALPSHPPIIYNESFINVAVCPFANINQ